MQKLEHHAYEEAIGHETRVKRVMRPVIKELLWYARDQPLRSDSSGSFLPHKTSFWRWQLDMEELTEDFHHTDTQDFFKEVS